VAATGTLLIVVPEALPYDAAYVSGADAIMVTHSNRPVAMRAAADVILGVARPTGLLPVSIPAADGQILSPFWARPELLGSLRTHVLLDQRDEPGSTEGM
jgi:beta-N-acetylhexosaminidase